MPAKHLESFLGEEGTHILIGADVQMDQGMLNTDGAAGTPPLSPMPPMGEILSRSELRDAIAYLVSLR